MEFFSHDGALVLQNTRFHLKGTAVILLHEISKQNRFIKRLSSSIIAGCSWFGCETETYCVHGLWQHSVQHFLGFLTAHGFNAIRLPFTADLALSLDSTAPTSINYAANPDLQATSLLFLLEAACRLRLRLQSLLQLLL